jgi:hypothetical protein
LLHWISESMRGAYFILVVTFGCNGQFDFDASVPDGGPGDGRVNPPAEDVRVRSDAVVDAPLIEDVHAPQDASSAGRVACGAASCALPRVCCVSESSSSSCTENESSACNGLRIQCDSDNDCAAGLKCCATVTDMHVTFVHCEDPMYCASKRVLCDPNDPSECASCGPAKAPLPAGYYQCL